ncbi:MAG: hypothetical protein O3C67_12145 [Cyanobacteria bacterium]|nr:hypothetical protein [Cyanobacteriota bacterium]
MVVHPSTYSRDADPGFAPHQIVVLEHGDQRLYGEVIQVVTSRQRCWVRPLAYAAGFQQAGAGHTGFTASSAETLYDLQQGPDVIWPLGLFQAALDLDWLSMLSQLQHRGKLCDRPTANRLLRTLLNAVCPVQSPRDGDCRAIVPYRSSGNSSGLSRKPGELG